MKATSNSSSSRPAAAPNKPEIKEPTMSILRIEHPVPDYQMWKSVFDSKGPDLRTRFGARRYQVLRPVDDPRYVMIDVDFDSLKKAEGFLAVMRELWAGTGRNVSSEQKARIAEAVESNGY
jgi:hypothetical protein